LKKIGLLGGMGWYSTYLYYQKINKYINRIRNRQINPEIIVYSANFEELAKLLENDDWVGIAEILIPKAVQIEQAGADFLVITSNTMHKIKDEIQKNIDIPILSIIDVVGKNLKKTWCKRPGLLATKYLIKENFYQDRLEKEFAQKVITPAPREIEELNNIIVNELVCNDVNVGSRYYINSIIDNLMYKDVDAIILGCAEFSSLIDIIAAREVRIIDSLELHVRKIVHYTLRKNL